MRFVVLTLLTPFTACIGFLGGTWVAIALGISLHDNYEYFSPDYGAGMARVSGMILCYGGGVVGALVPWLFHFMRRKS
jgi:hypothetical protein